VRTRVDQCGPRPDWARPDYDRFRSPQAVLLPALVPVSCRYRELAADSTWLLKRSFGRSAVYVRSSSCAAVTLMSNLTPCPERTRDGLAQCRPWAREVEIAYLAGPRDDREVWIDGERMRDVTRDPRLARGIRSIAELYDLQLDLRRVADMPYRSRTSGEPVGLSHLQPHSIGDLIRRRGMIKSWPPSGARACSVAARTSSIP
jgi:hypothetical protein